MRADRLLSILLLLQVHRRTTARELAKRLEVSERTILPVLLDALWRERQVRFLYRKVLCEAIERTGDPLSLVAKGSVWYLIAKVDDTPRTYRVPRISEAVILEQPSTRPSEFDLAAYWE